MLMTVRFWHIRSPESLQHALNTVTSLYQSFGLQVNIYFIYFIFFFKLFPKSSLKPEEKRHSA